ncbi:MAG: site-specific recombinase XerD [Alphaproteobacteria bacterium]|nr:site-specific recombinase XerD [Alphaproteobacteria bacterium]
MYGNDDPVFQQTAVSLDKHNAFQPDGLKPAFWSTTAAIREVFKNAFADAGLPYFNPHSFRKTLTALGQNRCTNAEGFKAWSQNLGHDSVLTTFTSYGAIPTDRQGNIITSLGKDTGDVTP